MSDSSDIQALSRVLDALYQCVTESTGWDEFKTVLSKWLGATACEFHLPSSIGQVALPGAGAGFATAPRPESGHRYTAFAEIGEHRVGLSAIRSMGDAAFDQIERGRLDIVASHLAQAIQLRRIVDAKETTVRGARTALEYLPTSVALLGRRGKVMLSSAKFAAVAEQSAHLSILDGHVVLRDPAQQSQLLDHLDTLSARLTSPLSFLFDVEGGERLYGTVRSLLGSHLQSEWPISGEYAIAVFILERAPSIGSPDALKISASLGISPAQARLVSALVTGRSIKEYAFASGISIHTARTHLKKVFAKLGVQSQAGLIRVVLTKARDVGTPIQR